MERPLPSESDNGEEPVVGAAVVAEPVFAALARPAVALGREPISVPETDRRQDDEVLVELDRVERVDRRDHLLVQFFTGPDADDFEACLGRDRLDEVHDSVRRNPRHEQFSAPHPFEARQDEVDALLQRQVETRHALIGDRKDSARAPLEKKWNDRSAAPEHVSVPHDRERDVALAAAVVGRHEELVGRELARAVQIDRRSGFIRAERDHPLHSSRDGCVDHVLGAENVRLDHFERVVLGSRHLLQRRRVNHDVDAFHRLTKPSFIANVADDVVHHLVAFAEGRAVLHVELLELVAAVNHDAAG